MANPFLDPATAQAFALAEATGSAFPSLTNQAIDVATGNIKTITISGDGASTVDQIIQVSLQGSSANKYVCTGANTIAFDVNGFATFTIPAGQDSVTVTLVDTANTADNATLTVSFTDAYGNPVTSNQLAITFDNPNPAANTGSNVTGQTRYMTDLNGGIYPYTYYEGDAANNSIVLANNYDAATDSGQNLVVSGDGNDLIVGNGGQNVIVAGNGDNQIYANTQLDFGTAIAQQKTMTASGAQGDLIAVGSGDNTIIGGNGNDLIIIGGNGDTSYNEVVLGAGNNIVIGGQQYLASNYDLGNDNTKYPYWDTSPGSTGSVVIHNADMASSGGYTATSTYMGNRDAAGNPAGISNDVIFGGTGDSSYYLSNGDNWLDAGGGNDYIHAGAGDNTIFAGKGNDTIWGGGGSNYIDLESGNDLVVLQGGNSTVYGGTGDNVIISGDDENLLGSETAANNYIYGGSGNTSIFGSGGNDMLVSGSEAGTGKTTTIVAGDGNEIIVGGNGNDTLFGGAGSNTIYAGDGDTAIQLSSKTSESSTVYDGMGNDTVWGGAGHDTIYGGSGNDTIFGGAGSNTIYAGDGNAFIQLNTDASETSTVYGGAGSDTIIGGAGSDTLIGGTGTDIIVGGKGHETIYTGDGNTTVQLSSDAGETSTVYGGMGDDTIFAGAGTDVIYTGGGNTAIQLSADAGATVTVYGEAGNNTIYGGAGTETIYAGDNTLFVAGTGNETVIGGGGNSTYAFNAGFGNVAVQNIQSTDTIQVGAGIGVADLTVSATVGSGGNLGLTLQASSGGSLAIDFGLGSAGNNFVFADTGISMTVDEFMAQANWVPAGSTGGNAIYGWNGGNTLIAGSGDQTLYSNSGYDTLVGGAGNDTLVSAAGHDTMVGGTGNTTFVVNSKTDQINAISTGSNINTVLTSVSLGAPAEVQNLKGTGSANITLTGNDLNNVITANSGNDALIAGSGVATLVGGAGNDTFVVNNVNDVVVAQSTGSNINTVQTLVDYVAPANVQNLTGTGSLGITLRGNDLNNVITANSGNDTLIAGTGIATLVGGPGNDTFVVNNVNDVVVAQSTGSNINTVQTSVDYTAPDYVQNLTGIGSADVTLTGNNLNNVITANGGDDTLIAGNGNATLIGGAGTNTMYGGTGNNTFVVNSASDVIHAQATGTNTVVASFDYVLPENVQNLQLMADNAVGTGNDMTNVLIASGSNDTLIAGTGVASMFGNGQNETFVVNNSSDFVQAQGTGNTILTSVDYTAPDYVQYLTGTGSADITLTGNDQGVVITANSGNDTLTGGRGDDTLIGGTGRDTFTMGFGMGHDTVTAASLQGAVIQLGSDVTVTTQQGNDLLLQIDQNDSMLIKDYYSSTNPQNLWTIKDAHGLTTTPQAIMDAIAQQSVVDRMESAFINQTKSGIVSGLSGYRMVSNSAGTVTYESISGPSQVSANYLTDSTITVTSNFMLTSGGIDYGTTGYRLEAGSYSSGSFLDSVNWDLGFGNYTPNPPSFGLDSAGQYTLGQQSRSNTTLPISWDSLSQNSVYDNLVSIGTTTTTINTNDPVVYADPTISYSQQNLATSWLQINNWSASSSSGSYTQSSNFQYQIVWSDGGHTIISPDSTLGLYGLFYNWYETSAPFNTTGGHYYLVNSSGNGSIDYSNSSFYFVPDQSSLPSGVVGELLPYSAPPSVISGVQETDVLQISRQTSEVGAVTGILLSQGSNTTSGFFPNTVAADTVQTQTNYDIQKINLGSSGQTVYANAYSVVNSTSGNDIIYDAGFAYGGSGNDAMIGGGIMLGGTGNDTMIGGNIMIAGSGNDRMFAGAGEATFQIDPGTVGTDIIGGAGSIGTTDFLNNFYQAMGINDWQDNYQHAGMYYLNNGWYSEAQISTLLTHISYGDGGYQSFTVQLALQLGIVTHGPPPLPVLFSNMDGLQPSAYYAANNVPVVNLASANDFQGLASLYDQGILAAHTVAFGAGVLPSDLQLSWSQTVGSISGLASDPQQKYTTLNISWGANGQSIQVMIPHTDDLLGSGVSGFTFADGTTLTMAQMIAMAPPAPSFDPSAFVFQPGMGVQVVDSGYSSILFGAGITPGMITLGLGSLMLRVGTDGDVIHIINFDPSNALASNSIQKFIFADGTSLTYGQMLDKGFDIYGTTGDETLSGTNLANRIYAGSGNDTLIGTGTSDTLVAGAGVDTLIGGTGNETFVINNANDVVVANANAASNSIVSSVSYALPGYVQNFTLTGSDNLTATGNELDNVITANSGNDTLIGGGGNDTFVLNQNGGHETIIDNIQDAGNVIGFGVGITAGNSQFFQEGADLLVNYGTQNNGTGGNSALIKDFAPNGATGNQVISQFQFADGSQGAYTTDGQGNANMNAYDANNNLVGDFWQSQDGSYGNDTFNADGTSSGTDHNADGSYSSYTNAGQGDTTTTGYDANGVKLNDSWTKVDGTYGNDIFNADGSSSGTAYEAWGSYSSYSNDGQGNVTTNNFDASGNLQSYSVLVSDGHGNGTLTDFDANGIELGYSVLTNDGAGNTTTTNYDASDVKLKDIWTKADGTYGNDNFSNNGNGASSGKAYNVDGSYSSYANDGHGNVTTNNYNANGHLLSDTWQNSDGYHGSDIYNADGSSSSTTYNPDGSYYTYTYDGLGYSTWANYDANGKLFYTSTYDDLGYTTWANYDANGIKLDDGWNRSDGSYGNDIYNGDGSSSGTAHNPNHSYSSYTNDGNGNSTTTNFDANGVKLNDNWIKADGTHGSDTFNANGTSSGTAYKADGSHSNYSNDENGVVTTVSFDAGGTELSYNVLTNDGYGNSTITNYDANGIELGYSVSTNDGSGNTTTTDFDANGTKLSDSWTKADGTYGSDSFNVDGSYIGIVNAGLGGTITTNYDANGIKLSDSWIKAGGSSGNDTFNADGSYSSTSVDASGNTSTNSYDANGSLLNAIWQNSNGYSYSDTYTYDANGNQTDTWQASDGYHGSDTYNVDGSSSGTDYYPDGSYYTYTDDGHGLYNEQDYAADGNLTGSYIETNDGLGNSIWANYDDNGTKLNDGWNHADGSYGNDTFNADGSSIGNAYNADGSHSSYTNDGSGNATTTNYDANSVKLSDSWTKADGTYGNGIYNADGTSSGTAYNSWGGYSSYANNGLGNITTNYFDASGYLQSYSMLVSDGQGNGTLTSFDVNGNVLGSIVSTNDGLGDTSTTNFDANGIKLSDSWTKADKSYGNDTYNADGSSSGMAYNPDGSYSSSYANALYGYSASWNYDANGNLLSDTWRNSNGSGNNSYTYDANGNQIVTWQDSNGNHGIDTYNTDGSSSGTDYSQDGSYYIYTDDGQGAYNELDYGADGRLIGDYWNHADGSYGNDTSNADGTSSGNSYTADGSYSSYTNDGLGDVTTDYFDTNGNELSDSWIKADGTHGNDTFNADGTSSGTTYQVNGSYTTYIKDVNGNISISNFDANGNPLTGYSTTIDDGLGNTTVTNFDANGVKLGDSWTQANGTTGSDTFNSDGGVESQVTYTYADGSTYSTDTVSDPNGSYQQSWSNSAGSTGSTDYNAVTGEVIGSNATAGAGYSYTYDNTQLGGGVTESQVTYAYADGSTYSTDTVSDPNGSYQQSWSNSAGNSGSTNYNAATGEVIGSNATAGAGYSYTYDNTQNVGGVNGVTESVVDYTYADGSTYSTDTVSDPNGSYQQSWSNSAGSSGSTDYNAVTGEVIGSNATTGAGYSYTYDNTQNVGGVSGVTESVVNYTYADGSTYSTDTISDPNGSYQQSWSKSDGGTGSTDYNAVTGEVIGSNATAGAGYSYTYDNTQNVGGVSGVTESKVDYTYADGSTYSTDTISDPNGSYQQSWSKSDGGTGSTDYNAVTGEVIGSNATAGAGYSYTYDNTQNVGGVSGVTESVVNYTYADGSTYSTDTVSDPNGSYQQSWSNSAGSSGSTDYNSATGEVIGSNATAGAGYSYTYDNTQNVGGVSGVTESKVDYTYADGSTYSTDTVNNPDGSYFQAWNKSDGTAGSNVVNASGTMIGDSWVHIDGSQGVDAGGNHLMMGGAGSDALAAATGNELIIGGIGNDTITTGSGTDMIAFNKGDGQDMVNAASGQNNTISLGGSIAYGDLALKKNGNDLVLDVGTSDSITFKNWYAGAQNIVDLQVIASSMSDFAPGSTNVLSNSNVENFDFQSLVSAFDQALAADPTLTAWGITDSLLSAHLASSDTAALGGDLAYQYNLNGTLAGIGLGSAQTVINDASFGVSAQQLHPLAGLQTGTARLG